MDDFETGPAGPSPALIAVLAGCAALVGAMLAAPLLDPLPLPTLLAAGAGAGLVVWIPGFVLAYRRAGIVWTLGALVLLVAAGALAGFGAHRRFTAQVRTDASSFAELELAANGEVTLPGGAAARGPLSRLLVEQVRGSVEDARAFGEAMGRLDAGPLSSPYLLQQRPAVLGKCAEIGALKALAAENGRRRRARSAALASAIDAAALSPELKRGMTMMGTPDGAADARLAADVEMLDASEAMCRLLARRSWYDADGYFAFRSAGDRAAFDALTRRGKAAAVGVGEAERAARERLTQGQEIVRDVLSR